MTTPATPQPGEREERSDDHRCPSCGRTGVGCVATVGRTGSRCCADCRLTDTEQRGEPLCLDHAHYALDVMLMRQSPTPR